jgi:hypothetical protein
VETVSAERPERAEIGATVCGIDCLRRVFHDPQRVSARQRPDRIHLTADACVVHGHDHFRARRDRLLHESLIDVQRVRPHVDELQRRAAQQKGVGSRNERVRGQYDFVAGADVAQQSSHLQSRGA